MPAFFRLSVALLACSLPAAALSQVEVQVVSTPGGHGVKSKIITQIGGATTETPTDANGRKTLADVSCASGAKFKVKAGNPLWIAPKSWASCQQLVRIEVRPSLVAGNLEALLRTERWGESPAGEPMQLVRARTELGMAVNSEDWAEVPRLAAEVSRGYAAAGRPEQAFPYDSLAQETATRLLENWAADNGIDTTPASDPLTPRSPALKDYLMRFQREHCLETRGEWTDATYEALEKGPESCARRGERG